MAQPSAWFPDEEALRLTHIPYLEHLKTPDTTPLSNWLASSMQRDPRPRHTDLYSAALYDMTKLLEEVRFGIGVGALYATGLREPLKTLSADENTGYAGYGIPLSVRALLSPYAAGTPLPEELLRDPSQPIAGARLLGGWWAAQLYDSAISRGLSVLDRLATLLYCAADRDIKTDWFPSFRSKSMLALKEWNDRAEWGELISLLDHELFAMVKRYRDGFVHSQRLPMELHGDHVIAYDRGPLVKGTDAGTHEAIAVGFFALVISPAITLTGQLLSEQGS